jgi:hypothetical protein
MALEVALLRRRERLVEDDDLGLGSADELLQLVGLAGADEERGVGSLAPGDDTLDDDVAGGFGKQRQLVERFVEGCPAAEVDADENRARRRLAVALAGRVQRHRAEEEEPRLKGDRELRAGSGSSPHGLARRSRSHACRPSA